MNSASDYPERFPLGCRVRVLEGFLAGGRLVADVVGHISAWSGPRTTVRANDGRLIACDMTAAEPGWLLRLDAEDGVGGAFDAQIERRFGYGQCHALALALHRRTRWPLVGSNHHELDGRRTPDHIFAIRGERLGIDIYGAHSRGRHPRSDIGDDWETLDALPDAYEPPDVHAARPVAETLLQLLVIGTARRRS